MKNERLFAIVNHLLTRGRTDAQELARLFEVCERTIYRDIDSLSGSGVPVVAIAGAGGGFEIAEGFRIDRSFLSREELADLTGTLGGFVEALKSRPLERSLAKLAGLGPRGGRPGPGRPGCESPAAAKAPSRSRLSGSQSGAPAPPLVVALTPWGGPSPDSALVELLRTAVAGMRAVALRYRDSRGGTTEREVEPFSMVLGGAVWYLHAWCRLRHAFRLFRLSRVIEARPLGEVFDPWRRAPVPEPFSIADDEPLVDVVLAVGSTRLAALAEAFGDAAVAHRPDGTATVSFHSPAGDWLEGYVLSLGADVAVLEPPALRTAVRIAALAVARANRRIRRSDPDMTCQGSRGILPGMEDRMSDSLVAHCGLDCNVCPARIAFLKDDPELRRRTAEEWSSKYNVKVKAEDVFCSGCRVEGPPKICHCGTCEVRLCGIAKGMANCGECPDYPTCATITSFLQYIPDAKKTLDAIHGRTVRH